MVQGVRRWLKAVSRLLDLDDYLLPGEGGPQEILGGQQQPPVFIPHGFPGQSNLLYLGSENAL